MIILGLNAYHGDSSACIIKDGVLIAAAEEERFRRIKHWAGFPSEAIKYCLEEAGIRLEQVDFTAVNRYPRASLWRRAMFVLSNRPNIALIFEKFKNLRKISKIEDEMANVIPGASYKGKICFVEHHKAHLVSAFFVSPYEQAVSVSVDGFGDFASTSWGIGKNNKIDIDGRVFFPHSLGIFYQALTQYLGFPNYGDEYKVMGLAPYGKPHYMDEMRKIVRLKDDGTFDLNLDFFRHHIDKVSYEWEGCSPEVGTLYTSALETLLGPVRQKGDTISQKHIDIARSIQAMYEEAFFHLLNSLHAKYKIDNLALAGGCAMNSVANGKISRQTPFKNIYIQSAAGDAGGALGAALSVWYEESDADRHFIMDHANWGPGYSNSYSSMLLEVNEKKLMNQHCDSKEIPDTKQLCQEIALAISEGKVVGWFQGRMEWGPRALGNRSILGDPRRANMKEILNVKIKRRESFRPFAPSILREKVSEWFEIEDEVPFMMKVFPIKESKRKEVPAVTHVDGSGRLQTVTKEANPLYHQLIQEFYEITGVPMVLNTSFNENEPVVCKPEEALDCFLRTKMDLLVLGNHIITRQKVSLNRDIRKRAPKLRDAKIDKTGSDS
ncbi:MAG: carbamoyltransferase C-terminal domain-containing protein [Balneolales bacterium]